MKHCATTLRNSLTLAIVAGLVLVVTATQAAVVGNGYSTEQDPKKAGVEAAEMAKKAIDGEAKVVLVYDSVGGGVEGKEAMLRGVETVFDAKIIYGCSSYAPITQDCNTGTVAVLAISADIGVVPALADFEGDAYEACGKEIGESLKKATSAQDGGQLVLLFGDCHVPSNDKLVQGVTSVLGEDMPVAGGAAMGGLLYYQGKVLKKANLGLLLTGDFSCSFSAKNAPASDKDAVVAAAGVAAKEAIGDRKPVLVFAFDCGGRRGQMGGSVDQELALMKAAAGSAPIFGFYGSGETGPKDNKSPARGVGYHIVICSVFAE